MEDALHAHANPFSLVELEDFPHLQEGPASASVSSSSVSTLITTNTSATAPPVRSNTSARTSPAPDRKLAPSSLSQTSSPSRSKTNSPHIKLRELGGAQSYGKTDATENAVDFTSQSESDSEEESDEQQLLEVLAAHPFMVNVLAGTSTECVYVCACVCT